MLNIGPGSPTGMTFGYGAKFPAKYQKRPVRPRLELGQALRRAPRSRTVRATRRRRRNFSSGAPLPLTDAIIHPADGAMYFAIGGRRVQSGLYRVTYVGQRIDGAGRASRSTATAARHARLRHSWKRSTARQDPQAVSKSAWPYLGHEDRFIRWAARTAIEHQPVVDVGRGALTENRSGEAGRGAAGARARAPASARIHRTADAPPVDKAMRAKILDALVKLDWTSSTTTSELTLVRTIEIVLNRSAGRTMPRVAALVAKLDPQFPAATPRAELAALRDPGLSAVADGRREGRSP